MRFAHLKTHHSFERLRLRGLSGARDEFHPAASSQFLITQVGRQKYQLSDPVPRRLLRRN